MRNSTSVLVTRPRGQAGPLCEALVDRGYTACEQPLLELQKLTTMAPGSVQQLEHLDEYQHIIFISGNAVRFGMEQISSSWPRLPGNIRVYAVGDSTAGLLQAYGIGAISPGAAMNSESLLALDQLQDIAGERVLIVKGLGGRGTLREVLLSRGAEVDELACYERKCPVLEAGELAAKIASWEIDIILISSGEALRNLLMLLSPAETIKLYHVSLIVPSERVARMAAEAGFGRVYAAQNASNEAMLEMVEHSSLMLEKNK